MIAFEREFSAPRAAFIAAFLFSACVCVSLVCERLAHGPSAVGLLWSLAVTLGAAALVILGNGFGTEPAGFATSLRRLPAVLCAHLLGIASAIALVHLAMLYFAAQASLAESPAQLVNDGVLIVALLCLVWSYAARSRVARAALPILSFALVGGYALSKAAWHVDPFPGFEVQSYVVGQVLATAAALLGYYLLRPEQGRYP
jgi:hypothetical protein